MQAAKRQRAGGAGFLFTPFDALEPKTGIRSAGLQSFSKRIVNSIVLQWLEREAEARVEERIAREVREERAKVGLRWKDWRERKAARELEALHQKFREIEEEYRRRERRKEVGTEKIGNGS